MGAFLEDQYFCEITMLYILLLDKLTLCLEVAKGGLE